MQKPTGYEQRTNVFGKSLSTKTLVDQNPRSEVEFTLVCKGIIKMIEECDIKIEDFTRFIFKSYPKETAKFRKGFYNPNAPRTQEKGDSSGKSSSEKAPTNSDATSHGNSSPTVRAKGHSRAANNAPTNQKKVDDKKESSTSKEDGNQRPITSTTRVMFTTIVKCKNNDQQDQGNQVPKESKESGDSNSSSESTDFTKKRQRGCRGRGGKRRQDTKQVDDERKFVSKSDFEEWKTIFAYKLSDLDQWRSRQDSSKFLKREEAEDIIKSMVDRKQAQNKLRAFEDEGYYFRNEPSYSSSEHDDERDHYPRRDKHQVDHRRAQRSSNSRYDDDRAERKSSRGYY